MNHRELIAALTPLHGAGEARAIVRMVMEERFGLSQTDLLLGKDTELSRTDREEFEKIAQRLLAGEPVQHVLGYADFCGHRFRVTPDVLIPRPETEELVRWAIDIIKADHSQFSLFNSPLGALRRFTLEEFSILDLCTGSGCIAISLALAFPEAQVLGVDISDPALTIARENAASLAASNVRFTQQDILNSPLTVHNFNFSIFQFFNFPFSLLTANPPYVRASEAADIHPTVLDHEPGLALFVPDEDPLRFYRAIARIGREALIPGGHVLVEINAALADETRTLFADHGYTDITIRPDQFGRPRILKCVF